MVRAEAGARIFDKLEPELELHKNGPAPQHCMYRYQYGTGIVTFLDPDPQG
jgi:hypothetical protein